MKSKNNNENNSNVLSFQETFPITLTYKNNKEDKVCYFQCEDHLKSYLKLHKLNKNSYSITKTKPK